jgi:para-aminobenzoate synthetase component 1
MPARPARQIRTASASDALSGPSNRAAATQHAPLVEPLTPLPDPVEACERLAGWPYRLFLDSAVRGSLGRYSFLTADPVGIIRARGPRTEYLDRAANGQVQEWHGVDGDALNVVRRLLVPHRVDPVAGLPPFQGGAAGYIAYDWGRVIERVPPPRHSDLALPDAVLGVYDWVIAWDHEQSAAWLVSTGLPETDRSARQERAARRAGAVRALLRGERQMPATGRRGTSRPGRVPAPSHPVEGGWWDPRLELRSSFTHARYLDAVARVREYIFAGDIFQSNLSQRFEAPFAEAPWSFYRRLRVRSAAPFAAFLDFPDAAVLSASPERFLRVETTGRVETRPIKGTRPRGFSPEHDAALGLALTESAKDRAENLMIVDLMRNDLSRVCSPGTVRVAELFALEHYATVHHLVSTVVGELMPDHDALDLLRASFPGGSITGAPKLRAMEIIAELEPSERGVYCGTIGYWSLTGSLDSSIAIRTAVALENRLFFGAGGGIVADSDPEQEYRETLDKARGMIDTLAAAP